VLLIGVPGNIHALMHPDQLFALSLSSRAKILEVPRLPLVDQIATSRQPLSDTRLAAEGLTFRWLVDNAANGKIPAGPPRPSYRVSTDMLQLYLAPTQLTSIVTCKPLPLGVVRDLAKGDKITIKGASVFIRLVPATGQPSFRLQFRPATYVALAGPLHLRIVAANPKSMLCE